MTKWVQTTLVDTGALTSAEAAKVLKCFDGEAVDGKPLVALPAWLHSYNCGSSFFAERMDR